MEVVLNVFVVVFIGIVYCRILLIARQHHIKIGNEIAMQPPIATGESSTSTTMTCDMPDTQNDGDQQEEHKSHNKEADLIKMQQQKKQQEKEKEQAKQKQKNRRREFKALYLTSVIVYTWSLSAVHCLPDFSHCRIVCIALDATQDW